MDKKQEKEFGLVWNPKLLTEGITEYDAAIDTLYLYTDESRRSGAAHFLGNGEYVLYDPENFVILGFMIEDFRHLFVPRHQQVSRVQRTFLVFPKESVDQAQVINHIVLSHFTLKPKEPILEPA